MSAWGFEVVGEFAGLRRGGALRVAAAQDHGPPGGVSALPARVEATPPGRRILSRSVAPLSSHDPCGSCLPAARRVLHGADRVSGDEQLLVGGEHPALRDGEPSREIRPSGAPLQPRDSSRRRSRGPGIPGSRRTRRADDVRVLTDASREDDGVGAAQLGEVGADVLAARDSRTRRWRGGHGGRRFSSSSASRSRMSWVRPDRPRRPDCLLSSVSTSWTLMPSLVGQELDHGRVHVSASRAHQQPLEGSEPHGGVHRVTVLDGGRPRLRSPGGR